MKRIDELAVKLKEDVMGWEEEILRAMLPSGISHTTIHRLVGKVTDPSLEAEEREIEEVYEDGVMSESEGKVVSHLLRALTREVGGLT